MAESLEKRFKQFLNGLPAAESVDDMAWPTVGGNTRKADYLLGNREVIVEIKTLSDDPSHKAEAIADKHREREEWPLFCGTADVRKVLTHLPDGATIYGKLVNALGRSVEATVRSAEEQITQTRHVLDLPNAVGLLVILNESIQILDPYVVGHRVAQLLRRPRTGNSTAQKLDYVWLMFESHAMGIVQGRPSVPSILIEGKGASSYPWFSAFHDDVVHRWTKSNGGITVKGDAPDPSQLRLVPMQAVTTPPPKELPRHEVWRRQYRAQPYLRTMNDEAVLAQGADIVHRLTPHFVTGDSEVGSELVTSLLERFTHFQEEASYRALDWRNMPKL
jgi:hypothetical protein